MLRLSRIIGAGYILLALVVIGLTVWLGPLPLSSPPFPIFPTPTPERSVNELFRIDVEVLVASNASDTAIRKACIEAYREQAIEQFGSRVTFQASNVSFQARGGSFQNSKPWEKIGEENGKVRYLATLQAFVQYYP
jgi:hypothetical protein